MMLFFHATAWGIPLLLAAIAYGVEAVGNSQDLVSSGGCWITCHQLWWKMVLWMFIDGKGWKIIAYIATDYCALYIGEVPYQIRGI